MRQEAELVPYTTTRLSGSPLLVLAPHPDDEIFGGGPLLLEGKRTGAAIHVIVATDGVAQGNPETRRAESREAAHLLGTPEPEFWPFADRSLSPSDPKFLDQIRQALDRHRPEMLVIPSPAELHPDHRAMALAVYRVLKEPGRLDSLPRDFRVAAYEISAFMRPNALVDITDDWTALMNASEAFSSQNDIQPYLEVLDAVAVARRLTLDPKVKRAAAFFVVDAAFISEHDVEVWASQQGPTTDPVGLQLLSLQSASVEGNAATEMPQDLPAPSPLPETETLHVATPAVGVSVVVRTKDRPDLLREALQSLASQNHRPLEAVVVNDGGVDVTDVVNEFEGRLEIIHERLEPARGRCAAANRALELASGPWVAFLDDDDIWLHEGIARLLASAPSDRSVVYGSVGAFSINPDTGSGTLFHTFGAPFNWEALLFENFIPIIGCLMPLADVRSIGGIDESLDCFEDWDLFLRLSQILPFEFIDVQVAQYRVFGDGFITGAGGQELQHRGRTAIYEKHWSLLSPETLSRMQFHAKAVLMPAEIALETVAWRQRVQDLERGNRDLEHGVINLKEKIIDRDRRLKEIWKERQEIDRDREAANRRAAAMEQKLKDDPIRGALVSVIIVNFNGRHHLEKCLPAVALTERVRTEVIVVDNGSDDDSLVWMRTHHPDVRIIEIGANVGFGEGNRQGMLAARGAYAAFLNSDTVVEPDWLHVLVRALCLDPTIGAACSTLRLLEHPEILNGRGGSMSKLGYGYDRHFGCPVDQDHDTATTQEVFFPTAAAMLMRTHEFFDLGGFDEKMFMYHEDVDLGWRLWLLGRSVVVCRDSVVHHHFGGTTHSARGLEWRERMGSRHNVRSILKHYQPINVLKAMKGLAKLWIGMGAWRHTFHVVAWNVLKLPSTLRERWWIQRRRHLKDADLFSRGFISPSPYPAPTPEIRNHHASRDQWIETPVLRPGHFSAIGRLGPGWFPAHPIGPDEVRPFCGDARCGLKVTPDASGAIELDIHVPKDAIRGGNATLEANGVETSTALTGKTWQTIRLEGIQADRQGIISIRLQTPSFRPHVIFENWDFRRLGGAVRSVVFRPDHPEPQKTTSGVSVLITTFRRWPVLAITLDALRAQGWPNLQVIVMDDGSDDETWEALQHYRDLHSDTLRLTIATQKNQGQGRARNNALALVEEDLVLFLGDDIIPEPGLIRAHVERHNLLGEPAAVVGFTDWYRQEMSVTPFMEMVNLEGHQFGYDHMTSGSDQPFTCFYTSNISIDRSILGDEPFDPTFSSYGWEDVELGYRLSIRGVRIVYEETARAGHFHPTTVRTFYRRQLQVGRAHNDLLAIHPELVTDRHMPPQRPPKWYRLAAPFSGLLVAVTDSLDRRKVPTPKKILHHVMMIGFYKGQAEGN